MTDAPLDRILRDIEPRKLALAGGSILAISVLAALLYVIKPAWLEYSEVKAQHEQTRASLGDLGPDAASSIATLESQVSELRDSLYGDAAGVPRSQIESFVVDSLDRISSRHGIALLGITPDEPTSVWMFQELPYTVQVEGSYFSLHRWLYDVEEELRPMVVKQFQLKPSRNDDAVVLDLRVVAYRAPEEAGA